VDRSRDIYPGESKTDTRDAHVIADQARMSPNLQELTAADEGGLSELRILLARRRDSIIDQTRTINRLRDALLSSFPALWKGLWISPAEAL
jgi:Transposase